MRYILLLMVTISLLSCDATKKTRTTTYRKSTKHRKTRTARNKQKVKKPNWRIKQDKPPITDDMPYDYGYNLTSEKKEAYDVTLLMPMRAQRVNESEPDKIPKSTLRFIEFLGGGKTRIGRSESKRYSPQCLRKRYEVFKCRSKENLENLAQ